MVIGPIEIPRHWSVKKLGDVCYTTSGGTPSRKNKNFFNGNIPWVKSGELDRGVIVDTEEKITPDAIETSSAKIFPKGTLLIALYGATIGKLAFLGVEAATNQAVCGIFENEIIKSKFLYYFLAYKKPSLVQQGIGGAQPNISQGILKDLDLPIPPINEQSAIVSKIEELFSELDTGIAQLKTAQQQLKVYRQSLLKAAFEGRLTHESVREDRLPKGWDKISLKLLVEKIADGPFGSNLKTSDYVDKGIRVIRLENIGELEFKNEYETYVSHEKYETIKKHTVGKGDIIFSSFISDSIRVALLPNYINKAINKADCFLIRPNDEKVIRKYLLYYLSSKEMFNQLSSQVHGATRPRINTTQLKECLIPVTSIKEQVRVIQIIESIFTVCDKIEETINKGLQQAESLRQSILKKAFEGKLVGVNYEIQQAQVIPTYKPQNEYFYQVQILALIAKASKEKGIGHGEMTLAKYAYLADKIFDIPTYYDFQRWHLGPYPPEIKKAINNKKFFTKINKQIELVDEENLLKYNNPYREQIVLGINELTNIFSKYKSKDRGHETELLATVCKVVEDIQLTDLKSVRKSMAEWKIELNGEKYKTKAEKFTEAETKSCVQFLIERGWDKKLLKQ